MFAVLIYLFEHYMHKADTTAPDPALLTTELEQEGFAKHEIYQAFEWLEGLADDNAQYTQQNSYNSSALRVYTPEEQEKLDISCRGFLLYLEQNGILRPTGRELIIDRAMAIDTRTLCLDELKWVALFVIFNMVEQETDLSWMENLVFAEADAESLH